MDILCIDDSPIIGYVKIRVEPLVQSHGPVLTHFRPGKWILFIVIIRILWSFSDLRFILFDSPKDLVFRKLLVLAIF